MDQPVVVLTDLSHCDQGLEVLIGLVGVDVMQGATVPGVPIGGCEINGYLKTHIFINSENILYHCIRCLQ